MKSTYRNIALAAGGALAVGVAAGLLRARQNGKRPMVAQTLTVLLERQRVLDQLDDRTIQMAVGCETMHVARDTDDSRLIEWHCEAHPSEDGRLAMMAAPADRGTELHVAMRTDKGDVKEVLRRLKMLLETGELATGERQ